MTEVRAASLAELQPGSMRQVTVAGVEIAYYSQDGNVVAALGVERNGFEMAALQELARMKRLPRTEELKLAFNPIARLRAITLE